MASYLTPASFVLDTDGAWRAIDRTGGIGKSMYKSENTEIITK